MNILRIWSKQSYKFLLQILFPKFCIGCSREGEWLCFNCAQKTVKVMTPICPECAKMSENGKYCLKCRKGKALKGIISALYFEEGPTKELIHNFKYNSVTDLANFLAQNMSESLAKLKIKNPLITWVPLHRKRFAQRGYNQSELLAKCIAQKMQLESRDLLVKNKPTKRQALLKGAGRRANLERVFNIKYSINLRNQTIVIVDDIATTGTTLNECAKVLKQAGAKEVWGLVVARG